MSQWVEQLLGHMPRGSLAIATERFADKRTAWTDDAPDARLVWYIAANSSQSVAEREVVLGVGLEFVANLVMQLRATPRCPVRRTSRRACPA